MLPVVDYEFANTVNSPIPAVWIVLGSLSPGLQADLAGHPPQALQRASATVNIASGHLFL